MVGPSLCASFQAQLRARDFAIDMLRVALLLVLLSATSALLPPLGTRGTQDFRQISRPAKPRSSPTFIIAAAEDSTAGRASLSSSTINLVKAIVGSGVLSLPVGIAAFSSSRSGVVPAIGITAIIAAISAYCFSMVGYVCEATQSASWGEAWSKTVGARSSWIPSSFVALLCASQSLQYTMVIGDSFSSIFSGAGFPLWLASRNGAIASLTLFCTLPLCLLPSLDMLKYTSSLGIGGIVYTAVFMCLRAMHGYEPGSALHAAVAPRLQPSFGAVPTPVLASVLGVFRTTKVFVLMSILATAFCAHFIAPQFYNELAPDGGNGASQGSPQVSTGSKMGRFNALAAGGFGLSAVFTAVVMAAGYLTFGSASDGYILNNYAQTDALAQAARLGIGLAIVCTYPILHQGLRDTTMEAMRARGLRPSRVGTTLVAVGLITALGMALTNLGTVAAISGALVSTSLVYTLPSLMLGQLLSAKAILTRREKVELVGARLTTLLGIILAAIGIKAAL